MKKTYLWSPENRIELNRDGTCLDHFNKGHWKSLQNDMILYLNSKDPIYLEKIDGIFKDKYSNKIWLPDKELNTIQSENDICSKYVILIISCQKRKKRQNLLRQTWVKDMNRLGFRCIFVIGNNHTQDTKLFGDILWTDCNDYYEGLPEKIIKSLSYIYQYFHFEYVFKIDDDCVLNPISFLKLSLKNHYIGVKKEVDKQFNRFWHKGKCSQSKLNTIPYPIQRIYYHIHAKGESGYFLSKYAISLLLRHKKYIESDLYEDKVVGDVLWRKGIILHSHKYYKSKLFHSSLCQSQSNQFTVIVDVPEHHMKTIYYRYSFI